MPDTKKARTTKKDYSLLICALLVVFTSAAYRQVKEFEFVNYDDDVYVSNNTHVHRGLTLDNIAWAFTTAEASNYHPLTWLSYMSDSQLFGMGPGPYHIVNLILHIINALLLFAIGKKMGLAALQSGFLSALFALHPLHVESVAWIAERKDVLSCFFWMTTLLSYLHYAKKPSVKRYIPVLAMFLLGLLSKPMVVTIPFVLLLMDYWPLKRLDPEARGAEAKKKALDLIKEKAPLFLLTALFCFATYAAQKRGGALSASDLVPLSVRTGNGVVAYSSYLVKTVYPHSMAVLYPHPMTIQWAKALSSALFLLSVSYLALRWRNKRPWFLTGWLWYLGTLVPVIGFVQVGGQAMADRYTYIPLIGIFLVVILCFSEFAERYRQFRIPLTAAGAAVAVLLAVITHNQTGYWKDGVALFSHAIEATENNSIAHNNLGAALLNKGRSDKAMEHFVEALRISPDYDESLNNLGNALEERGLSSEALKYISRALQIRPDYAEAHNNLGNCLQSLKRYDEAISHYKKALRLNPDYANAYSNMGNSLMRKGEIDKAIENYLKALEIRPDFADARNNLGAAMLNRGEAGKALSIFKDVLKINSAHKGAEQNIGMALEMLGRTDQAISHYSTLLEADPSSEETWFHFANIFYAHGRLDEAEDGYRKAIRLRPGHTDALINLGNIFAGQGRVGDAVAQYEKALSANPDNPVAHVDLANMLQAQNRLDEALAHYMEAIRIYPEYAEAHNNMGAVLFLRGDIDGAILHLKEALRIKPDYADAQKNLAAMERLKTGQ